MRLDYPSPIVKKVSWTIIALMSIFCIINSFSAQSQTTCFTREELIQLATNNVNRKQSLEIIANQERQIDTLERKIELLDNQIVLLNSRISNFQTLVVNLEEIEEIRITQIASKNSEIAELKKQHKKSRNENKFWRIFTPTICTAISITAVIVK